MRYGSCDHFKLAVDGLFGVVYRNPPHFSVCVLDSALFLFLLLIFSLVILVIYQTPLYSICFGSVASSINSRGLKGLAAGSSI